MDWPAYAQLLEDWQTYKARLRKLAEEGLVPRETVDLTLELTKPRISTLEASLRRIAERLRTEALERLERHGGTPRTVEVRDAARGRTHTVMRIRLSRPVKAYVAYDGKHIYLVRNVDEDDLPIDGKERGKELEKRVLEAVKRGEAETYPADLDERPLTEVELPPEAAKLLGADRAPLALMLNMGWLLSDDERNKVVHMTARPGQVAVRIVHWLALAEWAVSRGIVSVKPTTFKLSVSYVAQTREGLSPMVWIWPIGRATEAIRGVYERFGVQLGDSDRVRQLGYALLRALRVAAFERRGKAYAVRHVSAWLAFAAALKALVLGDGYVYLTRLRVAAGDVSSLAGALGGHRARDEVVLKPAMLRAIPPVLPSTSFEKDAKLYRSLALFVRGIEVSVGGRRWLLYAENGGFRTEDSRAAELAETLKDVIGDVPYTNGVLRLSEGSVLRLVEMGLARLLSETEYEAARREVTEELGLSEAELEALAEAARLARRVGFGEAPYAKRKEVKECHYTLRYAYLYYDDEKRCRKH